MKLLYSISRASCEARDRQVNISREIFTEQDAKTSRLVMLALLN